ncbi:MAG: hypothetical protein JW923_05400 [Spirochaetales bacterium]|nr:hypothetical protein [Spirochaetales bacterium]
MEFIKALKNVITKQKRKAGVRAYYSSGTVFMSRLFGYRLVRGHYEPDERFAPAIKTINEMLAAGKTLLETKAALDEMKARDSSNNRYSFARITALIRPIYAGYIEQRGKLVGVKNLTPIVTLEIYRKAKKQLKLESKNLLPQ